MLTSVNGLDLCYKSPYLYAMKPYNLFLDDIRNPSQVANYMVPFSQRDQYRLEDWLVVRNYEEFVEAIEEDGIPAKISFDHDLADIHYDPQTWTEGFVYQEKTGYDCLKWLVDRLMDSTEPLPIVLVHSQNPVGAENIEKLWFNFKKHKS